MPPRYPHQPDLTSYNCIGLITDCTNLIPTTATRPRVGSRNMQNMMNVIGNSDIEDSRDMLSTLFDKREGCGVQITGVLPRKWCKKGTLDH